MGQSEPPPLQRDPESGREGGDTGAGPQGQPPEVAGPTGQDAPSSEERTLALLAHLLGIVTGFLGPLIIWLVKKGESEFVGDQGKEALNFQLTVLIAYVVSGVLALLCIGVVLLAAVSVGNIVFCILAAVAANGGERYRYPVSIRFIK